MSFALRRRKGTDLSKRTRAVCIALLGLLLLSVPALAATKATIKIVGGDEYKINKYAKSTLRFQKDVTVVKSGTTITVSNGNKEPHTISIVKPADLPKTTKQMNECFEGGLCGKLFQEHEVPEGDGPPGKPVIDGGDGFNKPGDSIVVNPKGAGPPASFKVTAKKGTTLSYLCGVHPWMQAKIKVN
jgi:plastocyanin